MDSLVNQMPSKATAKGSLAFILGSNDESPNFRHEEAEDDDEEEQQAVAVVPLQFAQRENQLNGPSTETKPSKICIVDGCTSRAKRLRRCWRHGGSIGCTAPGCPNRAKTRGLCWSHGGGTLCTLDDCGKVAVSNGKCWAHGGGKRCRIDGCLRAACARMQDYCSHHYRLVKPS